ncbi:MAG: nucleoside triphosphate pyrophosphohydrolase [Candidatus Gracilibacteria bacterium]|nr:nucleoside triphosphate pyrophosphohydrolase [Candidatus Gracilibacteria bacterium]MDD2908867.1 nucleoside triphosphate pyrophosphohydrolase [Candidatus Gracilibacteria bacterium]
MFHNKLVRDLIPEIIESRGEIAVTRILDSEEYTLELKKKLLEEVNEFLESENDSEELADILEVVYALGEKGGISKDGLEKIRQEKATKRGGFKNKIYLIETK